MAVEPAELGVEDLVALERRRATGPSPGSRRRGWRCGGCGATARRSRSRRCSSCSSAMCLAAPLYAEHVAHTDPYKGHLTDQVVVDGKPMDVVAPDGVPIGPTWQGRFFLGADENGRDVAVRLLYGGRASLTIGVGAALLTILLSILAGTLAGYLGGWVDTIITRSLDIVWSFPVVLLGVALGTALALGGLQIGPVEISGDSLLIPLLIIGCVYVPYMAQTAARAGARAAREGVRRGGARAGRSGRCGSCSPRSCRTSRRRSSSSSR